MTKNEAICIALVHVAAQLRTTLQRNANATGWLVKEGLPDGAYVAADEPAWSVVIADDALGVGASRVVVVSQRTGRILFDGRCGE